MIAPSAGHKNDSSSVNVQLNIAGVDAIICKENVEIYKLRLLRLEVILT